MQTNYMTKEIAIKWSKGTKNNKEGFFVLIPPQIFFLKFLKIFNFVFIIFIF